MFNETISRIKEFGEFAKDNNFTGPAGIEISEVMEKVMKFNSVNFVNDVNIVEGLNYTTVMNYIEEFKSNFYVVSFFTGFIQHDLAKRLTDLTSLIVGDKVDDDIAKVMKSTFSTRKIGGVFEYYIKLEDNDDHSALSSLIYVNK